MSEIKIPIAVLGVGGHGRAVGEILAEYGSRVVYLDDDPKGMLVSGGSEKLKDEGFLREYLIVIGIGNNKMRHHFSMVTIRSGGRIKSVRHPRSHIAPSAILGMGFQSFPGSNIGNSVKIENFVVINNNASVAHDCIVRDGAQIADGATLGGAVIVGKRTLIGLGAVVLPRIKIGNDCVIGAGSVVTRDVPDGQTWFGNPARANGV